MRKAVMVLCMVLFMSLSPSLSIAQTKPRRTPVPAPPPPAAPAPVVDDLSAARNATDTFLKGMKIADLSEGKEMMREAQWLTGELVDVGYERPTYTEATAIFEKLFDTDIPGVQGYKRLLEVKAVSEAGTPLIVRYLMIAYKDKRTKQWKVLSTLTGERIAVDDMVAWSGEGIPGSELSNSVFHGDWLLVAGRIKEARETLTASLTAKATFAFDGTSTEDNPELVRLNLLKARSLLRVIDCITGDTAGVVDHP
jgi:hypothetical protein